MKANELRIGNIIWDKDKRILQVDSVAVGGINIIDSYDGYTFLYGEDDLTAIPLTEEWLLKFGFEKGEGDLYNILGGAFYWLPNGYLQMTLGDVRVPACNCPCKYVHQLQNIYFALTGEELTLKKLSCNEQTIYRKT